MKCLWCEQDQAQETVKNCTWIEPAGKKVLLVKEVPAVDCPVCNDIYVEDEMNEQVEVALHSVDLDTLGDSFTYVELMKAPRKSIFDLYREKEDG